METVPYTYNPNALVTVKKIVDGEATYETIKVVDLEGMLFVDPTIDVIESHTNGTHTVHNMKRTDIMEMFRLRGFANARLEKQETQIGKILNRLTEDFWFGEDYEKNEVLQELCEILEHRPVKTVEFRGTMSFEGTIQVPLESAEDFDLYYHLQDNLQLDTYDVDIDIDTYQVDEAEER